MRTVSIPVNTEDESWFTNLPGFFPFLSLLVPIKCHVGAGWKYITVAFLKLCSS